MSNFDRKLFLKQNLCLDLQTIYDAELDAVYIVNAGWVFKSIWYLISKCIPSPIQKKVKILTKIR